MTLAASVLATKRELCYRVYINSVLILPVNPTATTGVPGISRIVVDKMSPVPVCSIDVNRIPTWVKRGQTVTVDAGYDGFYQRIFTGTVQDRSRGLGAGTINCMGESFKIERGIEIPERNVDGHTVEEAIEDVLDYAGVDHYNVNVPAFTLGTASNPVLDRMTASAMLELLMGIDGCMRMETGSGRVIIRYVEGLPSSSAFMSYSTTTAAGIIAGETREDPNYFRNRVIVTGATVTEGVAPDETSRTITATATVIDSPLAQPALPSGTFIDAEYSNHLIDTDAKAAEVAGRLATMYARVPQYTPVTVPLNPLLELWQTLEFVIPDLDLDGRFWVSGLRHTIDTKGAKTELMLRGGDELGGTVNINPIAAFTFTIEREVMGAGVWVVVSFDASGSFDPDGTAITYAWSDNQTSTPEIATITAVSGTVRALASTLATSWDITLTVTDADALTGALTLSVPYGAGEADVSIMPVFTALNADASATPDGGQTWNDQASATCVSVAAKPVDGVQSGIAVYGYTDGSIKRTTDFCATALTEVKAAAVGDGVINYIAWDINWPIFVWAGTSTGRLYLSQDDGVTWALYKDFGGTYPINNIGTPYGGGVWVFGGRGDVPSTLIQRDVGLDNNWSNPTIGGELLADLAASTSALTIASAASFWRGTAIIFKGELAGGGINLFYVDDINADGTGWKRGTGLDAALSDGRYVIGDRQSGVYHAAFGDRNIWHTADGVAWTKTADAMAAGLTPNHCIWLGAWLEGSEQVHLVAAENAGATLGIYKSTDGLVTLLAMRPATGFPAWPATAKAKMLAVGAPGLAWGLAMLYAQESGISTTTYSRHFAKRTTYNWGLTGDPAAASQAAILQVRRLNGVLFRIVGSDVGGYLAIHPGQLQRSVDEGANWSDVGPAPQTVGAVNWGVNNVTLGADGTLWLCCCTDTAGTDAALAPEVWSSDDAGATWTKNYEDTGTDGGYRRRFIDITAHPTQQDVIAVVGGVGNSGASRTWFTTDKGVTAWTMRTGSAGSSTLQLSRAVMTDTGRLVILRAASLKYSDDFGTSWVDSGASFAAYQYQIKLVGNLIYASGGGASTALLKRSLTHGATWEDVLDDDDYPNVTRCFWALAYDHAADILYIGTDSTAATQRVLALASARQSTVGAVTDVTANLDSLFVTTIGLEGLAI